MTIKLIFVDGPTGSGKDYFIEELITGIKERNPKTNIAVLKATDFVLKGKAADEARKYVIHDIDEERLNIIYRGHHDLIKACIGLLKDKVQSFDLVVVNRSILTMLGTNLWQEKDATIREVLAEQFSVVVKDQLESEQIESLFIRIDVPSSSVTNSVNVLLDRINKRNDNKPIEVEWLYIIVKTYRDNHMLASQAFTYNEVCESGDSERIITQYLTK